MLLRPRRDHRLSSKRVPFGRSRIHDGDASGVIRHRFYETQRYKTRRYETYFCETDLQASERGGGFALRTMIISVELIPSSPARLERDLAELKTHFPGVNTVNIVDLKKFSTRSWQACLPACGYGFNAIPHIRAVDVDLTKPFSFAGDLKAAQVSEMLVITGDVPADMGHNLYDSTALQVIRKLRRELPQLKIYAALDPYRQNFVKEIAYARDKLEAGAAGLFTQPFFDLRLMDIYADLLPNVELYWGVTSVTSSKSHSYWRSRNKAVFPAHFEPTLAWSRAFAKDAVTFARERGDNLYFMPIKTSAVSFLKGIL